MNKKFKIDFIHQLRSARVCLWQLAVYLLGVVVFFIYTGGIDLKLFAAIAFLFWMVTGVLFCLPLHINYLKVNYSTSIVVDDAARRVQFITKNKDLTYHLDTLKITKYLCKDKDFRVPFSYYGYLMIECPDGNVFYATSLMMDPFKPSLPIHNTIYGFPAIPVF